MCHHREDPSQAQGLKVADVRRDARVRGHRGSRPRGNPPLDRRDLERSVEKLARVLGR